MSGGKTIAVLMGGLSAEREVSLATGRAVCAALERLGHKVVAVDAGRDLAARLAEIAPDIAFNALHGRWGEDGAVQGVLELMAIPYTHSGIAASAVAMDKALAKRVFASAGLPLAEGRVVSRDMLYAGDPLARPFVVKPVNEGSSVGVAIIADDGEPITSARPGPWQDFATLLVEAYVPGRELSVAVLDDQALGVVELVPEGGFYDYRAKYTDGVTRHVMPAPISAQIEHMAMDAALTAHRLLGCRGVSRSDFRYDDGGGEPGRLALLEINTQPGMTPLSLVPEIAAHVGIGFDDLVARLVADAATGK